MTEIDPETTRELTAWAKEQLSHHEDGIFHQGRSAFARIRAGISPVFRKRHNGIDYEIRAVSFLGEIHIYIERL